MCYTSPSRGVESLEGAIIGMPGHFSREFTVGWGDIDFNGHMRNTAYLDLSGTVRMTYFRERGFPMPEFERLRFGPVIIRDELDYRRELRLLDPVTVTLELAGLGPGGARFAVRNRFLRADGELAAVVTSTGGWLNLETRRLSAPPDELSAALASLGRCDDYKRL